MKYELGDPHPFSGATQGEFDNIKRLAEKVGAEIVAEYMRAKLKFPKNLNSRHEGYGVLKEEVDELWDDIKNDNIEPGYKEAIQVGAMALRYVLELRDFCK